MQVVECDDKLTEFDFGDSEEEEEEERTVKNEGGGMTSSAAGSQAGSSGGPRRGAGERGVMGERGDKGKKAADDEDFCILDSPTSTFVVRPKCLLVFITFTHFSFSF